MCEGTEETSMKKFVFFLANLCQKRIKVEQLGWVDALAVVLLRKTRLEGVR